MVKQLLLVFIGGGIGSALRFILSLAALQHHYKWWPTLTVNGLGCLVLGVLLALTHKDLLESPWYILLAVGLCGGLTTFSTFILEVSLIARSGNITQAVIYMILSIILGLIAGVTAYELTHQYYK